MKSSDPGCSQFAVRGGSVNVQKLFQNVSYVCVRIYVLRVKLVHRPCLLLQHTAQRRQAQGTACTDMAHYTDKYLPFSQPRVHLDKTKLHLRIRPERGRFIQRTPLKIRVHKIPSCFVICVAVSYGRKCSSFVRICGDCKDINHLLGKSWQTFLKMSPLIPKFPKHGSAGHR